MIWFSSDHHINHRNILHFQNRPFSTIEEMDIKLISNINEKIQTNDEFWIIGDFTFKHPDEYLKQIKCKNIYLVKGNHDSKQVKHSKIYKGIFDYKEIKYKEQFIIMFHYPIYSWNKKRYGSWHLYGHVHGKPLEGMNGKHLDIGVDTNNFYPYSFDDISKIMESRNEIC